MAIAGILAMRPEIMVLDEPTSGLDPGELHRIMHLLYGLNQEGMTIVISTHDVDLVPLYAYNVYIISDGKIYKKETHQKSLRILKPSVMLT